MSGQTPLAMDRKCISRIYAQTQANGSYTIEWIRTHSFHNPEDESELVFRSLPKFVQFDIFNQHLLGVSVSHILRNMRNSMATLSQRINDEVHFWNAVNNQVLTLSTKFQRLSRAAFITRKDI